MSWHELERLVSDVETDGVIRRAMKCCRSRHEFVLAARRLGYRITRIDLQLALEEEQLEQRKGDDQFLVL
ncbi:Nif11-like leader peptide family natural product precursor [Synechococcus sp. UW105]|jgi:predicted ribosomally synthesized peptide with nif11-like leader|uniref:Nif11-like leader peptide family natural product precursor n=1 Tax=unclassified Synechococcus TaxID=2626047 RepID=UPI000E0E5B15|nr:Nif11-like leader peptide family natural product precursor [Synechococcus sp. UW105]RZO10860.1 MAG: Nif11-like leader peptide family natural product precursor [Synechococcus sp. MED-G135]